VSGEKIKTAYSVQLTAGRENKREINKQTYFIDKKNGRLESRPFLFLFA